MKQNGPNIQAVKIYPVVSDYFLSFLSLLKLYGIPMYNFDIKANFHLVPAEKKEMVNQVEKLLEEANELVSSSSDYSSTPLHLN